MKIKKSELTSLLNTKHLLPLYSVWDKESTVPPQTILITERLLEKLNGFEEIESDALVSAAISDKEDAVEKEFSSTALNSINSLYYGYCHDAFTKHGDIANIYVKNRMVQYTLLKLMLERIESKEIRIHEFCCGGKYTRWAHFAKYLPAGRSMDVTLSDITADIIPLEKIQSHHIPGMKFHSLAYDLREPFPTLSADKRYDVMLVTYGFDSVWLPEDVMYVKQNGGWSQILYRVKVLPETENKEHILHLLRKEESEVSVPLHIFDNVVVECVAQPVDIAQVHYGAEIQELYGDYDETRVIVPGTMVQRIDEAFTGQLKDSGIMMIGEVATYPLDKNKKMDMTIADYNTTGKVGKYKVEDLWLAERILQHKGYKVEVLQLGEAAKKFGKEVSDDTEDTWVMIVSK